MSAQQGWTPATRPGIIPLHPLGFGTILGRSFTALRQNPKVLLGFALGVQVIGYVIMLSAVLGVAIWSFSRLDTLRYGTDDWDAVMAGSIALTAVTGIVTGLAVTALTIAVQGIVVAEVSREVVAEKESLGRLWQRVKPAMWRLIGYTVMVTAAVALLLGLVILGLVGLAMLGPGAVVLVVLLTIALILAAIPLALWLSTKLSLVPAVLVLERTTIRAAIVRSWTLIRGRFWPALGIIVIISVTMSTIAQFVSMPFSLLGSGITSIISPTGDADPGAIVTMVVVMLIAEAVVLLIQAVAIVVQSTAVTLIYIDCRMRHEGLDIDLLEYVDKRDAGQSVLPDPYTPHPERPHAPRPVFGAAPPVQAAYPAQPYTGAQGYPPAQPYPGAQAYPPAQPYPAQPYPAQPPAVAPPYAPQTHAAPPPPPVPPVPPAPSATQWAAPGTPDDPERPAS